VHPFGILDEFGIHPKVQSRKKIATENN